jgi:hypothetical protein
MKINDIYFILSSENDSVRCFYNRYRWGLLEIYPLEKDTTYNFKIIGYYTLNNKLENFSFINGYNFLKGSIYFDGKYQEVNFNQSVINYIETKDLTNYSTEIKIKGNDGIITIIISLPYRNPPS